MQRMKNPCCFNAKVAFCLYDVLNDVEFSGSAP